MKIYIKFENIQSTYFKDDYHKSLKTFKDEFLILKKFKATKFFN